MAEPKRILQMIGSLDVGGSQIMVLNLYRAIDKTKVQFDFIIDRPDQLHFADTVKEMGAKIYVMPTYMGGNIKEIKKAWNDFFKNHTEYKVLHSHVRSYASLYVPIAKKYGLKTIVHSHSTSNGAGFKSIVKQLLQYPLRYQVDYFFGCSKAAGEWLFGKKAANSNRFYYIKNAVDVEQYRFDIETRERYREQMDIGNKLVYMHIGRFHPSKNHEFLLKLFAELYHKNHDSVLVLVGDGELRGEIESQIQQLGIAEATILLGFRNDIVELLQAADVFLFPSAWEGLPMTVIEAQAAGLQCYISDRIPQEVAVSELVHAITLESGINEWIKSINSNGVARKDVSAALKDAGYDIYTSAKKMEKFYTNLAEGRVIDKQ